MWISFKTLGRWGRVGWAMVLVLVLVLAGGLWFLRAFDWFADRREWTRLETWNAENYAKNTGFYDPILVSGLPEPAERFFNHAISPGTPLLKSVVLEMEGTFSLGSKEQASSWPMHARQILALPVGFLWSVSLQGFPWMSGSDAGGWTRFRMFGVIPVARLGGGDPDHRRAAFGRYVAEAVLWTPAAILPSEFVSWEGLNQNAARVTVRWKDLTQAVDVELGPDGRPTAVHFLRWSNANPESVWRLQPFGGTLTDFRVVQGFRIPFAVEAGNFFGTPNYFPFFKAKILDIEYR